MTTTDELVARLRELMQGATPGPWSVNRHGAIVGGLFNQYFNGSAQTQLAMATGGNGIDDEQRSANTQLIAAIPEMVVALETLQREIGEALIAEAAALDILKAVSPRAYAKLLEIRLADAALQESKS